jgi:hypothetical protein
MSGHVCVVCGVFVVCVVRLGCVWWMLSCLDARPACDVAMLRSVVCCRRPLAWSMRTTRNMRHAMCDVCERSMSMVNGRRRSRVCGCARQLGAGCFARSMRAGRVSPRAAAGGGGRRRSACLSLRRQRVVRLLAARMPCLGILVCVDGASPTASVRTLIAVCTALPIYLEVEQELYQLPLTPPSSPSVMDSCE